MTEALDEELGLDICADAGDGDSDDFPEVTGSEAAFRRYIDEARSLRKDDIAPFRADASLAFHNVERGVAAIGEQRELIEKLPFVDVDKLFDMPNLALAVVYASALAARAAGEASTSQYRSLLSRANAVRRTMLLSLEACASAGIVPSEEIKPIRAGSGPLDSAGDVVALVSLFRKHADKLKNKTPISAADLHEASEVGTALLTFLKPKGTPVVKAQRTPEETADDRDRLWTLLVRGHAELRRVAGFVFGDDASNRVPALQSRARIVRKPTTDGASSA